MTKKLIRYEGEEDLQYKGMTGESALKVFKRLNNKYKGRIRLHATVGVQSVYVRVKRSEVIEMLSAHFGHSTRRFKNCEETTLWHINQSYWSLSIGGSIHQDFDKTKANNWGEEVEEVIA